MDVHVLFALALVAVFALGVFVAPKVKTVEAAVDSEVHALYDAGALEVSHVVEHVEARTAYVRASALKLEAEAQAKLASIPKDVATDVADAAKKV